MTHYGWYMKIVLIRFPQKKIEGSLDKFRRNLVAIQAHSKVLTNRPLTNNTFCERRKIVYAFRGTPLGVFAVSKSSPIRSEWFGLQSLSEYSSVSKNTLRMWIRRPENPLPAKQVGNKFLVRRDVFDSWLERHAVKPHSDVAGIVGEIFRGVR